MQRGEWLIAHLLILCIAGGSLHAIVERRDLWPFSHYPMYSKVTPDVFRRLVIKGVTDAGEIDLTHGRYFRPFHPSRILVAFDRIQRRSRRLRQRADDAGTPLAPEDTALHRLRQASEYLARRYEELRAEGAHDGPPLLGIRLYHYHWRLQSGAANRDRPDTVQRIAQLDFAGRRAP